IEPELVLGNINATDGTFPDKIEITWQDINYESGYRIKKGNQILIVTDENVNLYVDNNSLPGQVNTYTVEAINACKISNARSDLGFADPNGIISGHISTANGSFVEDVEVNVTPIVGTSLKFNGTPTGTGG